MGPKHRAVLGIGLSVIACALAASAAGCDREEAPSASATAPYPKGTWRLARHQLADVVLTLSHILVTYAGERTELSAFRAPGWEAEPEVTRTRMEALKLAAEIAEEARRHPEQFSELAAKYSEDLPTRDRGGSLGTWSAAILPEEMVDALATMKPGDVSRVIESELGFHVVKLRETPAEQDLSAREIVVSYQTTAPFDVRPGRKITRTRSEAAAIASAVALMAKTDPGTFSALVQLYSDHADAARDGDIGVWSTHDAPLLSRELEAVAALKPGQVSDPVDSWAGWKILMRTTPTERISLAVTRIVLPYASPPEQGTDRAHAEALASQLGRELQQEPERFAEFQRAHCCEGTEQWPDGRGDAALEQRLKAMAIDAISEPFETPGAFQIVRRAVPGPDPKRAARTFAIPHPTAPDVDHLVEHAAQPEQLAAYIDRLHKVVDDVALTLEPARRTLVRDVLAQLQIDLRSQEPEARLRALAEARSELRNALGDEGYRELRRHLTQQIEADIAPELSAVRSSVGRR